jgi:hypothetical protein
VPPADHETIEKISPIDLNHALYGNFIGLKYVFESKLDPQVLQQAIMQLLQQYPALAGRYDKRSSAVIKRGPAPKLVVQNTKNDLSELARIGTAPAERASYLQEPSRRDVLSGRAPLAVFYLTNSESAGCIFGMGGSHMLMDAAGFHKTLKRLAELYSAIKAGAALPQTPLVAKLGLFDFGTQRSKAETLNALRLQGAPKPIPITGPLGGFTKSMIIRAMEKIAKNAPVAIHFTSQDVRQLKAVVQAESGEPWISTNAALCAHFSRLIARLSYGEDLQTSVQLGYLIDLRGRYFEAENGAQKDFIGNAILIHIDTAEFSQGLQNMPRGALARYYKSRAARTDAGDVRARLDLLADCLRHGYTNPGLDLKKPIIALNNQSKFEVYDVSFAGHVPQRVIPQDVGDNIMFFPAGGGGIDIYIRDIVNPHHQKRLLTREWHDQIFDFK